MLHVSWPTGVEQWREAYREASVAPSMQIARTRPGPEMDTAVPGIAGPPVAIAR